MSGEIFSWLPFFEELLDIICKKYNSFTLYKEFKNLVPEEQYNDINQIDPLSFIGCICAGNKIAIKRALLVKERFNIQSNQISDINGIPNFVHGAYKYFHEIYKGTGINDIMKILWDFARQLNINKISAETFNEIINFKEVKVGKLSQIMYICKPNIFYSCDTTMLSYLYKNIENDYTSFLQFQDFCKTLNKTPYDLSSKAWKYSCQRKKFFDYVRKINKNSYVGFINKHILTGEFEQKVFQFSNTKLYNIRSRNELDILLKKLKNNIEWTKYDKANGNGIPNAILNTHYKNFISGFTLNMLEANLSVQPKYWIYSAGEKSYKWDEFYKDGIMAIGWDYLGDLTKYSSQEEIADKITKEENRTQYPKNDSKANWEFAKDMQIGDIVYVKKGLQDALIGRGIVKSDYIYDANRSEYKSIRKVEWTHNDTYNVDFNVLDIKQWNQKTLTEISPSKYKDFHLKIEDIFMNKQTEGKLNNSQVNIPLNQILYGPPGTGKTYNTIIKAMEIIGSNSVNMKDEKGNFKTSYSFDEYKKLKEEFDNYKNKGQIEFVTFHQSYSYEEFVEGIKPEISNWGEISENLNYNGKDGIFKQICNRAENDLYTITKDAEIDFDKAYKLFQEKYEAGSNLLNLKNIRYEENNLVYNFGSQPGDRRIDLSKIKDIFNSNKKYETATEFNRDYKGNNPLKGYFFDFYKELVKIKNCCDKENQDKNNINQNFRKYILIIDEINRGNISKIFGELITLIETDKRLGENYELQVSLPYSQESFGVPKNLYIIGTMNTSDRSIASIDIALRRRFIFKEIMPNVNLVPDIEVFGIELRKIFKTLNERISILLDRDHKIGHGYFMKLENSSDYDSDFKRVWYDCVIPLLNEYFYGDWEKLCALLGDSQPEGKSFIKKINNVTFANNYFCDEDETYDFVSEANIDFKTAIKNAFKNI